MAEKNHSSSSEQYIKRSNRRMLLIGLGLFLLFLLIVILMSGRGGRVEQTTPIDYNTGAFKDFVDPNATGASFPRGTAALSVTPMQVMMDNVVLGSNVESIITLTAQNAPIIFQSAELAESQQDGFRLDTTCVVEREIPVGKSCNIKVLWSPVSLLQLQNNLTINWRENSPTVFRSEKTVVQLKATSTDSKDCVICETAAQETAKKPRLAVGLDGNLYEVDDEGYVTIDGKRYKVTENGLIVDENGNVIGVVQPERLPLGLDHKVLGSVAKNQDVIDAGGKKLGRLLGDGTVVDASLTVIGAAVPVVSVMDDSGNVIGKLMADGAVVDATNATIGRPQVDGSVVDVNGKHIGYLRPWGLVLDFGGFIIGGVTPDGMVMNAKQQKVAVVKPSGFAVNVNNELVGGVVQTGAAVGAGCQSIGSVLLNGQVKDSYEQIVGRTLPDGSVVDMNGDDLGAVVSEGIVINEKGIALGFVNSEGKAVDNKGSVIGCVNPDASVMAGKRAVGAVMAKGSVVGYGCETIGSVYPNGAVVNAASETVARVLSDRYVKNNNNRVVGVVIPRGTASATGCRLLGIINLNGQVVSADNLTVGCIDINLQALDLTGKNIIGSVTARGLVADNSGKIIGRVRLDGKVVDKKGVVIGCVEPDGSVVDLKGNKIGNVVGVSNGVNRQSGVIVDENGNPTDWTIVGNKVYGKNGELIGELQPNGWVVDANGNIVGVVPPDGVIFSPDGLILGRYSRKTGVAVDLEGNRFARVLPDLTAVSGDESEIIGALIADKTTFMMLDGKYLGKMRIDGLLLDDAENLAGAIRADGTVVDKTGKIIGTQIKTGSVLGMMGGVIGTVMEDASVQSNAGTKIGQVLGNGLVVSNDGKVLGGVFPEISTAIGNDGLPMGGMTTDGRVTDKNGRTVGTFSPFGLVFGNDGQLAGRLVRIGAFVDGRNKTLGWLSFKGVLTGKDQRSNAKVLANGSAIDNNGVILGNIVPRGVAVDGTGAFVGSVTVNGLILGRSTEVLGAMKTSPYFFNTRGELGGQVVKPGLAVGVAGDVLGWTGFMGDIVNASKTSVGVVGLDGHVYNKSNKIIGTYVPFDVIAVGDGARTFGVLNADGSVADGKGTAIGSVLSTKFVVQDGRVVARLLTPTNTVTDFVTGQLAGQVMTNGNVLFTSDDKPMGTLLSNGLVSSLTKKVVAGVSVVGTPIKTTMSVMGQSAVSGDVFVDNAPYGKTKPNAGVYDSKNENVGYMSAMDFFIGREGAPLGVASGSTSVISPDGRAIAERMSFGSAITVDNLWAGGVMPLGAAVNDDAIGLGVVATDGAVVDRTNAMIGRVMSDGAVTGIKDRTSYGLMPYIGGLVKQGVPVSFNGGTLLGRTTTMGDLIDAMDKKVYRILDDGSVLGTDTPLAGMIISMNPAVAHNGMVIGNVTGDARVVSAANEEVGALATNGSVKKGKLKILGAVIPEGLVVNDCKVVGQTAHNGQVISGKGDIMGRILIDKWAQDTRGNKIGRVTRNGGVYSPTGEYLGRTVADSIWVDTKGIGMGCARNDGSVVDNNGNIVGYVVERGPVLDADGNVIGRVKAHGEVVNAKGEMIGKVLGDGKGTVVDKNGNVIGRAISANDEELLFNADGRVEGTLGSNGDVKAPDGTFMYKILPNGDVMDAQGNKLGVLDENGAFSDGILRDKNGNVIGIISGCDVVTQKGTKIGTIMPDGSIMDMNGGIYAVISADGKLMDAKGEEMGSISGVGLNLEKCGVRLVKAGISAAADETTGAGRRIFIGNKIYDVSEKGTITDSTGVIVGYMGDDGRPYGLNDKPLSVTGEGVTPGGRQRPDLSKQMQVNVEQAQQMQQLLAQRRADMKKAHGTALQPSARILAKAKKKEDADWGEGKIISSYPVDMSRMILKDKAIPVVLAHSIDSRFPDVPATAIVERNVFTESGRNILIPAGSRLIGKLAGSGADGKVAKVSMSWERLIRPDGSAFKLSASSGDAQGRGGVAAYLDNELMKKYGEPVMVSTVSSLLGYLIQTDDTTTTSADTGTVAQSGRDQAASDARTQFLADMRQVFDDMIKDSTGIPPVLFVPSGTRLTVFANDDLWLRTEKEDERELDDQFGQQPKTAQKPNVNSWVGNRQPPQAQAPSVAPVQQQQVEYYDPNQDVIGAQPIYDGTEEIPVINGSTATPAQQAQPAKTQTQNDLENRVAAPLPKATGPSQQLF